MISVSVCLCLFLSLSLSLSLQTRHFPSCLTFAYIRYDAEGRNQSSKKLSVKGGSGSGNDQRVFLNAIKVCTCIASLSSF